MSILNKYKKAKEIFRIINDHYYDFVLSLDDSESVNVDSKLTENSLCAYIDFTLDECIGYNDFVSLDYYKWNNAVNTPPALLPPGLTRIDKKKKNKENKKKKEDDSYNII